MAPASEAANALGVNPGQGSGLVHGHRVFGLSFRSGLPQFLEEELAPRCLRAALVDPVSGSATNEIAIPSRSAAQAP